MKLELTITADNNDYIHSVVDINVATNSVSAHAFKARKNTYTPIVTDEQAFATKAEATSFVKQWCDGVLDKAFEPPPIKL